MKGVSNIIQESWIRDLLCFLYAAIIIKPIHIYSNYNQWKKSVVYTSSFLNFFHQEIINVPKENRKLGNFKGSRSLFRNRRTKNLSTNNCVFLTNGHTSRTEERTHWQVLWVCDGSSQAWGHIRITQRGWENSLSSDLLKRETWTRAGECPQSQVILTCWLWHHEPLVRIHTHTHPWYYILHSPLVVQYSKVLIVT